MAKHKSLIAGKWRISSMTEWDQDFVDAEVPGYISFGYVHCGIDWRETVRDETPVAEFSFVGMDEMTPTSGRGWAALSDGQLNGMFYFHHGDESGFTATKLR
jgi:hypothetical protein